MNSHACRRLKWLRLLTVTLSGLMASCAKASEAGPAVSADESLKLLQEGNARFVAGKGHHPHADAPRRGETAEKGQHPFVSIVSCSDSRVPVEVIFDAGIGDLFVVRVAGNVCNVDEIGAAEYGTDHLGAPLLVVLGHTKCGAVTAVVTKAGLHGKLLQLLEPIQPAVAAAEKAHPDLHGEALVPAAIKANVRQGIENILKESPVIRDRAKAGKVRIVGAIYDLAGGKVEWLGAHPEQERLLALTGPSGHADAAGGHASTPAETAQHGTQAKAAASAGHSARPHDEPPATEHKPAAAHPVTQTEPPKGHDSHGEKALEKGPRAAEAEPHPARVTTRPAVAPAVPGEHDGGREKAPAKTAVAAAVVVRASESGAAPTSAPAAHDSVQASQTPGPVAPAPKPPTPAPAGDRVIAAAVAVAPVERCAAAELYQRGSRAIADGQYGTAAECLRAALGIDAHLVQARNDLAGVYYLQGYYTESLEQYNMLLTRDGRNTSALRGAALVYATQKQYPKSREMLQRLVSINDSDAQAWLDLGDVLLLTNDAAGARHRWNKVLEIGSAPESITQKARQRLQIYAAQRANSGIAPVSVGG